MENSIGRTGTDSTSSSGTKGLSPKQNRLSQSSILHPLDSGIEIRRVDDDDDKAIIRGGVVELPCELIHPYSLVLEKVMSFLDTKSLKTCRQVDRNWEKAAQRVLVKSQKLNVVEFLNKTKKKEHERVQLYSSWTVNPQYRRRTLPKHFLRKWGKVVKCLTLTNLSLDSKCMAWIRKIVSIWCPNVNELCLEVGSLERRWLYKMKNVNDKEVRDFRLYIHYMKDSLRDVLVSKKQHTFAPYPTLPNLHTLRVGKKSNEISSCLAINIILSSPNLKHLFLSELQLESRLEETTTGFRILEYLSRRPDITMKLETFAWQDANECFKLNDKYTTHSTTFLFDEWEWSMNRFADGSRIRNSNLPLIRFGDKLTTLHWDVLHVHKGSLLLPGILEQVAGNVRKLDLRKAPRLHHPPRLPHPAFEPTTRKLRKLWDYMRTELEVIKWRAEHRVVVPPVPQMIRHCFPLMSQLSIIQIGIIGCLTISLNDLVDSAPNLLTLEISGSGCDDAICDVPVWGETNGAGLNGIWEGSPELLKTHSLKCLKSGVSMSNLDILRRTVEKFPNLQELWIGHEGEHRTSLTMLDTFEVLKNLKSLKRFKWTLKSLRRFGWTNHYFDLAEVLRSFAGAANHNGIPSMESCHVRFISKDPDLFPYLKSDSFFENRDELLKNILLTKDAHCRFFVTTNCPHYFETESKPSTEDVGNAKEKLVLTFGILLPYCKQHGLPIEFKYSPTSDEQGA
jgi:hypothetical protein